MKPTALIEASKNADNLQSILNSMGYRYMDALCTNRVPEWTKAMHAIIDCFDENKYYATGPLPAPPVLDGEGK